MSGYAIPTDRLLGLLARRDAYALAAQEAPSLTGVARAEDRWSGTLAWEEHLGLSQFAEAVRDQAAIVRAECAASAEAE